MSTMRSRVLLLATAVLLVTGGAAAQAVFSDPDAGDAAPAPRKRASVAEPDAADAAPVAPRRVAAAPVADDAAAATVAPAAPAAGAAGAAAPVSAVADAGGAEEPQSLRPKTQLATKYEPGQKILNDEGLPLVDRYVAGSLLKSVKDSGGNTVCEMVLQGERFCLGGRKRNDDDAINQSRGRGEKREGGKARPEFRLGILSIADRLETP